MQNVEDIANPVIVNNYAGQLFEIGKPFEPGRINYSEGIQFDFSEVGGTILITVRNPTIQEIGNINSGNIKLAMVPVEEILFVLCKFGNTPWMEAPFNINLAQLRTLSGYAAPELGKGYGVITFLVDAVTGIVKVIRQTGMSNEFSTDFRNFVIAQNGMKFDKAEYNRKIEAVFNFSEQEDMLKKAKKIYELHKGKWTVTNK